MDYSTQRAAILQAADSLTKAQAAYDNRAEPDLDELDLAAYQEIERRGLAVADGLLANTAFAVQHINDPRDRLARQVGMLQAQIKQLCIEAAEREAGL